MARIAQIITAATITALAGVVYSERQRFRAALSRIGPKWTNLHPEVRARGERVLIDATQEFEADGLRVGVFDGWRTIAKQEKEISEGDSFVTHALRSFHTWGLAIDFVFIDKRGGWTWNPSNAPDGWATEWNRLGAIIERHGFNWGGRWQTRDGPHAELELEPTATLISRHGGFDQWRNSWA